jgi:hypothetical protein
VLWRLARAGARRVCPGPGQIAAVIGAVMAAIFGIEFGLSRDLGVNAPLAFEKVFALMLVLEGHITHMVAGAWLTLVVAGLWRSRPHWTDRLGRVWGWAWLVMMLVDRLFWPNFFG